MSDASLLALSVAGFFGGLLAISRTLGWVAGLLALRRPTADASRGPRSGAWPAALLLHSGPWLLALAVAALVRVASLPRPALGALCGGFGLALAMVAAGIAGVTWLRHRRRSESPPLTPQRLVEKRREFFFLMTATITLGITAMFGWQYWSTLDRDYPNVIIAAIISPLGGWLGSWMMWQWIGATLEVAEKRRRRRAERASSGPPRSPAPR